MRYRVLGIDPGSRSLGYGVVEREGQVLRYIQSGTLVLGTLPFPERLKHIFTALQRIVAETEVTVAAVETVFLAKNPSSALKLGQARGAAIASAVVSGCAVVEYAARYVKQALTGFGAAEKAQVAGMVQRLLRHRSKLKSDEADALALAITHITRGAFPVL